MIRRGCMQSLHIARRFPNSCNDPFLRQYLPIKMYNISAMSIKASISRKRHAIYSQYCTIARQNKVVLGGKYHLSPM